MLKQDEIQNLNSCLNKAKSHEMVFVLRAHDPVASDVIRYWIKLRCESGKNTSLDNEIREAWDCAAIMEKQRQEGI